MSNFANQWQNLKTQFGKDALTLVKQGGGEVPVDLRTEIIELVKLETGMSPALKVVDDAVGKKDAVAAMKALTKVHKVIEKTDKVFQVASRNAMDAMMAASPTGQDVLEKLAKCVAAFNKEFKGFEKGVSEAIEYLQEAKTGVKIQVFSLEGDLKGAVKKFEKDIGGKECKALEKKYNVMTRVDDALESMKLYSKAVAETEVKDAKKWLETYFTDVDDLEKYRKSLEAETPALDQDYLDAVEKLCKALKAIKNQRGQDSLRDLDNLISQGH